MVAVSVTVMKSVYNWACFFHKKACYYSSFHKAKCFSGYFFRLQLLRRKYWRQFMEASTLKHFGTKGEKKKDWLHFSLLPYTKLFFGFKRKKIVYDWRNITQVYKFATLAFEHHFFEGKNSAWKEKFVCRDV